jgi:hypothetical protein
MIRLFSDLFNIRRGEQRISINPKEILSKAPASHPNSLLLALEYKRLLDTPEIGSQTALAQKVGVSRARIGQFLRLLKLPQDIQQTVIKMGDPLPSRAMTERKLRLMLSPALPK